MSNGLSLGMIEVRGFLGAVVAADAGVKAASVHISGIVRIRGGLETVKFTGDVAAVNAAVAAGLVAIQSLNCLIDHYVIARMDEQTERLDLLDRPVQAEKSQKNKSQPITVASDANLKIEPSEIITIDANQSAKIAEHNIKENPILNNIVAHDLTVESNNDVNDYAAIRRKLERQRASDLKKQAYQMNLVIPNKSIKTATKRQLVAAIMREITRRDDK